jgi:hypothetical protein
MDLEDACNQHILIDFNVVVEDFMEQFNTEHQEYGAVLTIHILLLLELDMQNAFSC